MARLVKEVHESHDSDCVSRSLRATNDCCCVGSAREDKQRVSGLMIARGGSIRWHDSECVSDSRVVHDVEEWLRTSMLDDFRNVADGDHLVAWVSVGFRRRRIGGILRVETPERSRHVGNRGLIVFRMPQLEDRRSSAHNVVAHANCDFASRCTRWKGEPVGNSRFGRQIEARFWEEAACCCHRTQHQDRDRSYARDQPVRASHSTSEPSVGTSTSSVSFDSTDRVTLRMLALVDLMPTSNRKSTWIVRGSVLIDVHHWVLATLLTSQREQISEAICANSPV